MSYCKVATRNFELIEAGAARLRGVLSAFIVALALVSGLSYSTAAVANPALDELTCGANPGAPVPNTPGPIQAFVDAGFNCINLWSKGQLPSTYVYIGQEYLKYTGTTLEMHLVRNINGVGSNMPASQVKLCLDDDPNPINGVLPNDQNDPTTSLSPSFCEGGGQGSKQGSQTTFGGPVNLQGGAGSSLNCSSAEEPNGSFDFFTDQLVGQSTTFPGGFAHVRFLIPNMSNCTEVLLHFNTDGGNSVVGYGQPEAPPVPDLRIKIEGTATNEVGVAHTFTITVERDPDINDPNSAFAPVTGATPTVTLTGSNGIGTITPDTNTCANPGTTAAGTCTVTFNSTVAGQVTGHASVTVDGLTRDTDSATAGTPCGGGVASCGPAVKTYVDANISIAVDGTNPIGQPHTFTVTVQQNAGLGAGWVNAPSGHVDLRLTNSNGAGAVIDSGTCHASVGALPIPVDAGANNLTIGACSTTFHSDTAGIVTGNAHVGLTVGGVALTRDTVPANSIGAGPNGSGPAVKTYIAGVIRINKNSTKGGGTVAVKNAGAVFNVTGSLLAAGGINVTDTTDGTLNDGDNAIGRVCVTNLAPGATYTVVETTPPPGYALPDLVADRTKTAVAVAGSCSDAPTAGSTATFVDPPLADIQVRFRDGGSGDIVEAGSSINCTNTTGAASSSTADTPAWGAPTGTTIGQTLTVLGLPIPQATRTVVCTIVIDP